MYSDMDHERPRDIAMYRYSDRLENISLDNTRMERIDEA